MALPISPLYVDFTNFTKGMQTRQDLENGRQRNRLTELALQDAPARMAAETESRDLGLKTARLQYDDAQQQALGTGMAATALQMLQPLSNNDFAGAEAIYDQFRQQSAAKGLEIPEGSLKQALRDRNTTAIQGILSGTISAAQQRGWLKAPTKADTPNTVQEFQFAKQNGYGGSYEDWVTTKSRANNPPAYGQFLITPDGYAFGDRRTGEVTPTTMGGQQVRAFTADPNAQGAVAAAKEGGQVAAKAQTEAAINLPSVISNADQTVSLIDQALAHPGLSAATGVQGTLDPRNYVAGTDAKDFQIRLDQLKGKTFLEAFNSLKGAGAITDVEGRKAEEAIGRLNRAQSTDEFKKSLSDLRDIVQAGKVRSQVKAGQIARRSTDQQQPAPAVPAQTPQSPVLGRHPQLGDITEDDIAETMRANNMSREQVLQRLGAQ
jgi:hypothetical protein